MYDMIVIGAGPAGMTASLYGRRYGLDVLVLGKDIGGHSNEAHIVENWPGTKSIEGPQLAENMKEQVLDIGVDIKQVEVNDVEKRDKIFEVDTDSSTYSSRTLVLAMGTKKRRLNLDKEEEFIGKGVSYCTTCDAPLYKDTEVGVVGGSDSAAKAALHLAEHASKVYIIYRRDELRAENMLKEKCEENDSIEMIYNAVPEELKGNNILEGVKLDDGSDLSIDGLFIEIGSVPNKFLTHINSRKIERDDGYIVVDDDMSTNIEGVFAAGDITTGSNKFKQMITAAAEGSIAANSVYDYVREVF